MTLYTWTQKLHHPFKFIKCSGSNLIPPGGLQLSLSHSSLLSCCRGPSRRRCLSWLNLPQTSSAVMPFQKRTFKERLRQVCIVCSLAASREVDVSCPCRSSGCLSESISLWLLPFILSFWSSTNLSPFRVCQYIYRL